MKRLSRHFVAAFFFSCFLALVQLQQLKQNRQHESPSSTADPPEHNETRRVEGVTGVTTIGTARKTSLENNKVASITTNQQQPHPDTNNPTTPITNTTKLEFIHITKTGGSALERAAAKQDILWGACHYKKLPPMQCYHPDLPYLKPSNLTGPLRPIWNPWHVPPKFWKNSIPFNMTTTKFFTVVRDPYERMVSEYYCRYEGNKVKDVSLKNNPRVLNIWIMKELDRIQSNWSKMVNLHSFPQHHYVYRDSDDDRRKPREQIVHHVLRYENLSTEFAQLMQEYNLPIRLPDKNTSATNAASYQGVNKLTVDDISADTIKRINEYYKRDFELFGYEMLDPEERRKQEQVAGGGAVVG